MMYSKISIYAEKGFQVCFPLFLFFSSIFCDYTRANNLFHCSFLFLLGMLLGNNLLRHQLFNDNRFNIGFFLTALMLGYFCLTALWSAEPRRNLIPALTHTLYLLFFILMYRLMVIRGRRLITLWALASGMVVLLMLTIFTVDAKTLFIHRLMGGFFGAPSNVIDLGGYLALGIFVCFIIMRDTSWHWLYFPVSMLFMGLLLTQSRGPLLSLICAMSVILTLQKSVRKGHLIAVILIGLGTSLLLYITGFYYVLFQRIVDSYQHSFIRFDIWRETLKLVAQNPLFGWGLDKELSLINTLGDRITTTHSLFFAALLKGGVIGTLLLVLVIVYGLIMAKKHYELQQGLEGALFLFAIGFYLTQGMFIISNPSVSWNMFWFPLSVILTLPQHFLSQKSISD